MAGIYLHIPFCKKACHYCNFHFSTSLRLKEEMLAAMHEEISLQRTYLEGIPIETIYFGGGTPSLLSGQEINQFVEKIEAVFTLAENVEFTLEANPDDITAEKIRELKDTRINRISLGIQSFFEEDLVFMNRSHSAGQSKKSIELLLSAGYSNLTIDLIYGTPTMNDEQWIDNLEIAFGYAVPHLSCYCLTVEPKTALAHFVKKGMVKPVDEVQAGRQFEMLMNRAEAGGYEHYEISNFARPGYRARHNSNYWKGESYLGLGPSAHSFNGTSRQWNLANNAKYIKQIRTAEQWYVQEQLTAQDRYNEYIMTSLRTSWGCRLDNIPGQYQAYFLQRVNGFINSQLVEEERSTYRLSQKGKLLADAITADLFVV